MIPLTTSLSSLLQTAIRVPRVYVFLQQPLLLDPISGLINPSILGSQIVLGHCLSFRSQKILESGSDSADIVISNDLGDLSPLLSTNKLGKYVFPTVDIKAQVYVGIVDNTGVETAIPEGVFVLQNSRQDSKEGSNTMTLNLLDNFNMFQGDIYTQFPPRLYGNQTSTFFNPHYALSNPSGDQVTWVCDAVNWMVDSTVAPAYASDFTAVTVYVGTIGSPASSPYTGSYTVNYATGTVTFGSAISSSSVVSVDARPLGMSPELMLWHLFVEFGNFDPSFLKFDNSGIVLPIMAATNGQSIVQTAKDIALITSPRGIQWSLFFDELGYLNFRELALDSASVATLVDERDILSAPVEYNTDNMYNVVTASATAINQQPIEVVSYDVASISVFSQKPDYQVPSNYLSGVGGMDPGGAVAFMSGISSSMLFANNAPTLQCEIEILYNPLYQVGDVITVRENKTGVNRDFNILQVTKGFDGENVQQTLRIKELRRTQDFLFGLSAFAGAPIPSSPNPAAGQTALISTVTINGQTCVSGGQPVLDTSFASIIPTWNGGNLTIAIETVAPAPGASLWIWRWIYGAEDAYVLSGSTFSLATGNGNGVNGGNVYPGNSNTPSNATILDLTGSANGLHNASTQFYDFRSNIPSQYSNRFFWPLLRPSGWVTHDGVTAYTSAQSFSDTWTQGPGVTGTFSLYGNLRVGLSDFFGSTTSGYVGQALYAPGTPGASAIGANSTVKYGVDFGNPITSKTMVYGIKRKNTPFYLGILCATNNGIVQFKRCPLMLSI